MPVTGVGDSPAAIHIINKKINQIYIPYSLLTQLTYVTSFTLSSEQCGKSFRQKKEYAHHNT
jgi:hypothetical protein